VKTSEKLNCSQPQDPGFTRTDLLASLAVLALLAALALPSLGRGAGQSIIAQCAANLRQYDMALQIYGNENRNYLPINGGGNWAWDTSFSVVSFVTNSGVKWSALYCPGTSPRFTEQDDLNLFKFDPGYFSVLGYATTVQGTASFEGVYATNINTSLNLQQVNYLGVYYPVKPASRVLVADATLNESGNSDSYSTMLTYNWVDIDGGYTVNGQVKPHLCPHLNGNIPLGGNVGMLDGHVEWRNFKDMQARTGSAAYFYW